MKPKNFEVFRELLDQAGMADQARDFLMASGKLQALCYKHDIEAALRTRGFGGFQLLDLHDFPGQGTALVGVLDAFWDSKCYITAEQYRRFCAPTVPLARLDRMIWTNGETVEADVEIAHFGARDLTSAVVAWKLMKPDGKALLSGEFPAQAIQTGQNTDIGRIRAPLAGVTQAVKLVLEVSVEGTDAHNHWDLWCYPAKIGSPEVAGVHLTGELDGQAIATLQQGGKVWWMVSPDRVKTDVAIGFSSIFWNTAWTGGQAPHTLGILCDPGNPALGRFPSDFHSNWQWWDLVTRSATLEMDRLPKGLRPIVQVVPDWFDPKRLGLVFEAKVGKGRLLVSSMDLQQDLPQRPVARQLRHSLLHYMAGDAFQPEVEVGLDALQSLVHEGLRNQTDENGY
jgi:hypothetical protein